MICGGWTGALIDAAAYIIILGALFLGAYFLPIDGEW